MRKLTTNFRKHLTNVLKKTKRLLKKITLKKHRHKTIISSVVIVCLIITAISIAFVVASFKRADKALELRNAYNQQLLKDAEKDQRISGLKALSLKRIEKLQLHKKAYVKQKTQLKQRIKAKQAEAVQVTAPVSNALQEAPTQPTGCVMGYHTGNPYIDFIIDGESTGNSCAENAGGCFGLLQACPGAPLKAACGGNPTCQIKWFEANKLGGYGSWQAAAAFKRANGWW